MILIIPIIFDRVPFTIDPEFQIFYKHIFVKIDNKIYPRLVYNSIDNCFWIGSRFNFFVKKHNYILGAQTSKFWLNFYLPDENFHDFCKNLTNDNKKYKEDNGIDFYLVKKHLAFEHKLSL